MFIIRPINQNDLDGLMELLEESGHGLTSLPKDPEILKKRIRISERSFLHREDGAGGEDYLFVMEEIFTGKIVGVCAIISKIGGFHPYYFYRLDHNNYASKIIDVQTQIATMHCHFILNVPSEIYSLYLHPNYRDSQHVRFVSLSRFLFIAENRKYFEDQAVAEIRGMVNDSGHSPFWDEAGKN